MHLEMALGEELAQDRIGSVRAVNILSPSVDIELPQLVVKISKSKRSKNMAAEAWFYEELECKVYPFPDATVSSKHSWKKDMRSPHGADLDTGMFPPEGSCLLGSPSTLLCDKCFCHCPRFWYNIIPSEEMCTSLSMIWRASV